MDEEEDEGAEKAVHELKWMYNFYESLITFQAFFSHNNSMCIYNKF